MKNEEYCRELHKESFGNREIIRKSRKCGCFYCGYIFDADKMTDSDFMTERDGRQTAICPNCNIDSVIGDGNGTEINRELLQHMHDIFF